MEIFNTPWDSSAEIYLKITPNIPIYPISASRLISKIKEYNPKQLLDLGCGSTALISRLASEEIPSLEMICACDNSSDVLHVAKINYPDSKIKYLVSNVDELSKSHSNFFSAVACNASAWQIGFEILFESVFKMLEKNGILVFNIFEWDAKLGGPERSLLYNAIDQELIRQNLPPKPSRGSNSKIELNYIIKIAKKYGFGLISSQDFLVKMSAAHYQLFYLIPAIAAKSLPQLPLEVAHLVLANAMNSLLDQYIDPLKGHDFCFIKL